jgi:hypothetical protein
MVPRSKPSTDPNGRPKKETDQGTDLIRLSLSLSVLSLAVLMILYLA